MPVLKNIKYERFAVGIATGLESSQAYKKAGYKGAGARASAARLRQVPSVCDRIAELRNEISGEWGKSQIKAEIADRTARVDALNERWHLMLQIIGERAIDQQMAKVPGGKTGLLVLTVRGSRVMAEVDTAILRELRAHEEQAARELGQWVEKQANTDAKGKDLPRTATSEATDEALRAFLAATGRIAEKK